MTPAPGSELIRNAHVVGTSLAAPVVFAPTHTCHGGCGRFSRRHGHGLEQHCWIPITPLGVATPTSPTGSAANATPVFTWTGVAGAQSYDVWGNSRISADRRCCAIATSPGRLGPPMRHFSGPQLSVVGPPVGDDGDWSTSGWGGRSGRFARGSSAVGAFGPGCRHESDDFMDGRRGQ